MWQTLIGLGTAPPIISSARDYVANLTNEKEKAAGEIVDEAEKKANEALSGAKIVAQDVLEKAKTLSQELISKAKAEKEAQKELVEKLNAPVSYTHLTLPTT